MVLIGVILLSVEFVDVVVFFGWDRVFGDIVGIIVYVCFFLVEIVLMNRGVVRKELV